MARIPRSEQTVDFKPAMQPFSSGDGYEAPGRGLQKIGQGVQSLGGAIGSLQGLADKEDEYRTKLALLNMSNEQDSEDIERQKSFNIDRDDPDQYAPERVTAFDARASAVMEGARSQGAQRLAALQIARMRGAIGERAQRFGGTQKQQQMYFGAERAITGEFQRAAEPIPEIEDEVRPAPVDPETPAGGAAAAAGRETEVAVPAAERRAMLEVERFEGTLRAAEAIINDMPASAEAKQRLAKHAKDLAMTQFGKDVRKWPDVEAWAQKQQQVMGGVSGAAQPSGMVQRSGAPVDFLRGKLAPGYEKRISDVQNLRPEMQDRLAAFIAAAEDAGHDIRVVSGHRDADRQAVLWNKALAKYGSAAEARKHVAPPGGSTHQSGEAVDLQYQDRGAGLGGKRTAAVDWAHKNAARFGLNFPLGHEDWHIEPVEARAGGRRHGGTYAAGKTYWTPQERQAAAAVPVAQRGLVQYAGLKSEAASEPIRVAAEKTGMEPAFLAQIAHIESSGDPTKRTGSYSGLFQLSDADFRKYGGTGSITDPAQNALAAANKFKDLNGQFTAKFNRDPTPGELYLMHQQGQGGAFAHFSNPDRPAWQSMASTAEGRQKGEAWAKQAIWGNLTPEAKRQFGSVDNVTSRQFVEFWSGRVEGGPTPSQAPTRLAQAATGTATDARPMNTIPGQRAPEVAGTASRQIGSPVRAELVEAVLKAAPAMRQRYVAQVDQAVKAIEEQAAKGYEVPDQMLDRVMRDVQRSGDAGLVARMEMTGQIVRNSRATNQANPAELTAVIQKMEADALRTPPTPSQLAALDHFKKKRTETQKAIETNPYEWGTRTGVLPGATTPIRPDMGPDEMGGALAQRVAARSALMERTRMDLPFFQPKEVQELTEMLGMGNVPIESRIGILRTMSDAFGPSMPKAMKEIAKDAPELAVVGWLMSHNADPMAMKDAMRGLDLKRTDGFKSRLPSGDEMLKAADQITGVGNGAFVEVPEAKQYALQVAKMIYEARAERKGLDPKQPTVDSTLWQQAVNEAMGQNKSTDGKITYGGVATVGRGFLGFGGSRVFVPPWIKTDGGLDEVMSKLRMSDLVAAVLPPNDPAMASAAAAGRVDAEIDGRSGWSQAKDDKGNPVTVDEAGVGPAGVLERTMASGAQAVAVPGTPSGKPAEMSAIRAAQLVWIGGSRYMLRTGFDASGSPEYIGLRGSNQNYVLDMEKLRPLLERRVEKGTFRALQ